MENYFEETISLSKAFWALIYSVDSVLDSSYSF